MWSRRRPELRSLRRPLLQHLLLALLEFPETGLLLPHLLLLANLLVPLLEQILLLPLPL